ncbi:hypothetical protein [Burkholderia phage BCSR5]|nr:hypothetical protein [Burkholderia phage BCSR5]
MAFYFPQGRVVDSSETNVAAGAMITAEGQALVRSGKAPAAGVLPATGDATDIFVGFAVAGTSAAPFQEMFATKVEQFLAPAGGAVRLNFAPVTGQYNVRDLDDPTKAFTAKIDPATPNVVTGLPVGDEVAITYKYPLTVVQARALYGDIQPGGYVGDYVQQIGLIKRGPVFTDQYDASQDWSKAVEIYATAGGQLQMWDGVAAQKPVGVKINGYVIRVPGQEIPFLGIEFSAA